MHTHDSHPMDRTAGPVHAERFRLLRHPGETIRVVCRCAIGTDHDNSVTPIGPAPDLTGRRVP